MLRRYAQSNRMCYKKAQSRIKRGQKEAQSRMNVLQKYQNRWGKEKRKGFDNLSPVTFVGLGQNYLMINIFRVAEKSPAVNR